MKSYAKSLSSFLLRKNQNIHIYWFAVNQLLDGVSDKPFFTRYADPTGYGEYRYATNFLLTIPTFLLLEYRFVAVD